MNTLAQIREALAGLPVEDAALVGVSSLLNRVEAENLTGAAAVAAISSMRRSVDQVYLKRGEGCPHCRRARKHAPTCYLLSSTGWDLLEEHEATLRENDLLRAALAQHLPNHNGHIVRAGGKYRSLKDRARLDPPPS